jgi:hypothetical protein
MTMYSSVANDRSKAPVKRDTWRSPPATITESVATRVAVKWNHPQRHSSQNLLETPPAESREEPRNGPSTSRTRCGGTSCCRREPQPNAPQRGFRVPVGQSHDRRGRLTSVAVCSRRCDTDRPFTGRGVGQREGKPVADKRQLGLLLPTLRRTPNALSGRNPRCRR